MCVCVCVCQQCESRLDMIEADIPVAMGHTLALVAWLTLQREGDGTTEAHSGADHAVALKMLALLDELLGYSSINT